MEAILMIVQHMRAFNEDFRERYDYASRVQLALCLLFLSAAYLHTVVRRLAPGLQALLSIIPVVLINIWLPMLFSSTTEILSRVMFALSSFWLANFKALGLCVNRGPISGVQWTLLQVMLVYSIPIYPRQEGPVKKGRLTDSAGPTSKLFCLATTHAVALAIMAYVLSAVSLHVVAQHYITGLMLASFISFVMNGPAAVLTSLAELDVVPPFDKPWMASSLADFWGRRWNNTVGLTLRAICYDPIVEGCWVHKGPAFSGGSASHTSQHKQHASTAAAAAAAPAGPERGTTAIGLGPKAAAEASPSSSGNDTSKGSKVHPLRRVAGTAAAFAASGIMHEFILLYACDEDDSYVPGFWFGFFFCQVPLVVLEDIARRRLRSAGLHVPRLITMALSHVVILVTAYFFWYPPVEDHTDIILRFLATVNECAAAAFSGLQPLLQQLKLYSTAADAATSDGSISTAS